MEFEKYMDAYSEILARVQDKDVALAILSEVAKDRRTAEINGKNGAEKATQSQLEYLEDLGGEVKSGLTKAEASRLIEKAKTRK